jgi:hypothetical protein
MISHRQQIHLRSDERVGILKSRLFKIEINYHRIAGANENRFDNGEKARPPVPHARPKFGCNTYILRELGVHPEAQAVCLTVAPNFQRPQDIPFREGA